jgi:hypothetical protein
MSQPDHETAAALSILGATSWFGRAEAPSKLMDELAQHMKRHSVDAGHLFIEEGDDLEDIYILDQGGPLLRTKQILLSNSTDSTTPVAPTSSPKVRAKLRASQPAQSPLALASLREMALDERQELTSCPQTYVKIDEISGRGRVSGMLHAFEQWDNDQQTSSRKAFATITASGPAVVWTLNVREFQRIVTSQPAFAAYVLQRFAHEIRSGSKSIRGLMLKAKTTGSSTDTLDDGTIRHPTVIRVLCYDTTSWVNTSFDPVLQVYNSNGTKTLSTSQLTARVDGDPQRILMEYTTERLNERTATYAAGYDAVCLFVNDSAHRGALQVLSMLGVQCIGKSSWCCSYFALAVLYKRSHS